MPTFFAQNKTIKILKNISLKKPPINDILINNNKFSDIPLTSLILIMNVFLLVNH